MKILSKLSVIACLCWATLASCESPDYETGRTAQVNGLMSVTIQIPGNPSKFAATKTGPYEENEEIIVKVPTTDETPVGSNTSYLHGECRTQLLCYSCGWW